MEQSPLLMRLLLKDHTTSRGEEWNNIFWATDDYEHLGSAYSYEAPILPELITGENNHVIKPRVFKARERQIERSREMAEVFTPAWVCNHQNNLIDDAWFGREDVFNHSNHDKTWDVNEEKIEFPEGMTWHDYVLARRLEITCGEAPYMVSRYDSTTGEEIPIARRIGLLDRKLRVVSENTEGSGEWLRWAKIAFQNVYGYEWQGDSLLIARENLLMTFLEYYRARFGKDPSVKSMETIAYIVSWNFWQMDGLKGVIPMSCKDQVERDLLGETVVTPCRGCKENNDLYHNGIYCKIRTWPQKEVVRFVDLIHPEL